MTASPEDEWTQSQIEDGGNEDSQQITETITHHVINILKVTVLVIIGFILSKLLRKEDHTPTSSFLNAPISSPF